jgi:subtilisin family serine protease
VLERSLHRTGLHYPHVLVKRTFRAGPDGEVLESEAAMVADHILVRSELDEAELAAVNARYGGHIRHRIPGQNIFLIAFDALRVDTLDEALAAYGQALPPESVAEADFIARIAQSAAAVPNDPGYGSLWGLNGSFGIGAPAAWDTHTGDAGVIVSVIDTGIQHTHPDLIGNRWTNPGEIPGNNLDDDNNGYIDDIHGWNFVTNTPSPMDDDGHGTHTAGIVGAAGNNAIGVIGFVPGVCSTRRHARGRDGQDHS